MGKTSLIENRNKISNVCFGETRWGKEKVEMEGGSHESPMGMQSGSNFSPNEGGKKNKTNFVAFHRSGIHGCA
jgi:hypothetical protein